MFLIQVVVGFKSNRLTIYSNISNLIMITQNVISILHVNDFKEQINLNC